MIKVLGLYKNKKADGSVFLAGNLGGLRVVVMKNQYKTEEKHPDWVVFVDQRQVKKDAVESNDSDMEG